MKRTTKHAKENAKAIQPAFKTPAQELAEFKAKVLAMRYGQIVQLKLDGCPIGLWSGKLSCIVSDEQYHAADAEVRRGFLEHLREYKRLLKLNPDALKAYMEGQRAYQEQAKSLAARAGIFTVGELQRRGAPRKQTARDAKIVYLYDVQKYGSFAKIAQKLKIYDKHGAPSGAKAHSAYRRFKGGHSN
jgi:hypothetical protein